MMDILENTGIKHRIMEATLRYEWLDSVLATRNINIESNMVPVVKHSYVPTIIG